MHLQEACFVREMWSCLVRDFIWQQHVWTNVYNIEEKRNLIYHCCPRSKNCAGQGFWHVFGWNIKACRFKANFSLCLLCFYVQCQHADTVLLDFFCCWLLPLRCSSIFAVFTLQLLLLHLHCLLLLRQTPHAPKIHFFLLLMLPPQCHTPSFSFYHIF